MQVAGCIIQVAGCHLWPWAVWPQQRAASSMTLKSWSLISSSVIMGGHIKTIVSYKRYCRGISRSISMHYMQMIKYLHRFHHHNWIINESMEVAGNEKLADLSYYPLSYDPAICFHEQ